MKIETTSSAEPSTGVCKNCERKLPIEFFYVNKHTQCPDKFCKECRKAFSRRQYNSGKRTRPISPERTPYPVITEISDRELRMQLIFNALHVVQESMERKKRKVQAIEELL